MAPEEASGLHGLTTPARLSTNERVTWTDNAQTMDLVWLAAGLPIFDVNARAAGVPHNKETHASPMSAHVRMMRASQARIPSGPILLWSLAGSIESICHPLSKLALISSRVIRRGPKAPG